MSAGLICRGCKLEISGILLTLDLRVMDMTEFNVILGMEWLTTHRIVIDCERRELPTTFKMVLVSRFKGTSTMLCPRPCMTPDGTGN